MKFEVIQPFKDAALSPVLRLCVTSINRSTLSTIVLKPQIKRLVIISACNNNPKYENALDGLTSMSYDFPPKRELWLAPME